MIRQLWRTVLQQNPGPSIQHPNNELPASARYAIPRQGSCSSSSYSQHRVAVGCRCCCLAAAPLSGPSLEPAYYSYQKFLPWAPQKPRGPAGRLGSLGPLWWSTRFLWIASSAHSLTASSQLLTAALSSVPERGRCPPILRTEMPPTRNSSRILCCSASQPRRPRPHELDDHARLTFS